MHACDDHDNLVIGSEENCVGEATQKRPPSVSADNRISERLLGDGIDQCLSRGQKLMAQSRALTFVPEKSLIDVRRCRRTGLRPASERAIADAVKV